MTRRNKKKQNKTNEIVNSKILTDSTETVTNRESLSKNSYADTNNNSIVNGGKLDHLENMYDIRRMSNTVESQTDRLMSNYYLIKFDSNKCKSVFKYLISTEYMFYDSINKTDSNSLIKQIGVNENRLVFNQLISNYSVIGQPFYGVMTVFDGKSNMYASRMLRYIENKRFEVTITYNEKVRNYAISMQFDKTIDLDSYNKPNCAKFRDEFALFVDTAIKHEPSLQMIQIGQTFHKKYVSLRKNVKFDGNNDIKYLSANYTSRSFSNKSLKSLSFGTYISVENVMSGIALNVDRKPHYIYKPLALTKFVSILLDVDVSKVIKLSDSEIYKSIKQLNGLIIETTHTKEYGIYKKYRIIGITKESANDINFNWINYGDYTSKAQQSVSISEYFVRKYNRKLQFGHLPCIEAFAKKDSKIYLPIEVCRLVPDQPITRNLTEKEIEEQTRESNRLKPIELFEKIRIGANFIIRMSRYLLDKFGIIIDNRFIETNAKILSPPKLRYSNRVVVPVGGKWYLNDRRYKNYTQFMTKCELKHWLIVDMSKEFTDRNNKIEKFVEMLIKHANYLGMSLMPPLIVRFNTYIANHQIMRNIIFPRAKLTVNGLQMICFILPDNSDKSINVSNDELYREIKLIGDCYEGIITECINSLHIKKLNNFHIDNLLAKINTKLGATNVTLLELPLKPENKQIMIIGAHVLHRCNHDSDLPSICSVVGSYDTHFSKYSTRISIQPKTSEAIDDLANMIDDIIQTYRHNNSMNNIPEIIILYREFISDDQMERVFEKEMQRIENCLSKQSTIPKLTYIALTKRHNTKFLRLDSTHEDYCDAQNVCAGSVVEFDVTHPINLQFYLSSHSATIGTTRSLQVTVVRDDNQFAVQTIQQITNQLSYISANYTKSLCVPTPVYYSNLAANRANIHLSAFYGQSSAVNDFNILYPKLRDVLYFC